MSVIELLPPNSIYVVAAVIRQQDRIFLAKRPSDKHQGGLWEFPGGKRESNETALEALARELEEEIGIAIQGATPLIQVLHDYGDKHVFLDVYIVDQFTGDAHGREGQETAWCQATDLPSLDFPAANLPILKALAIGGTYAISPQQADIDRYHWVEKLFSVQQKLRPELVQLRFLDCSLEENISLVENLRERKPNLPILLNSQLLQQQLEDNEVENILSLLSTYQLNGIHFSSRHAVFVAKYAELLRKQGMLSMVSCHTHEDIEKAIVADAAVLSPVQATESHPEATALGWGVWQRTVLQAKVPIFALGGMCLDDMDMALSKGAQGIAGIRCWYSN